MKSNIFYYVGLCVVSLVSYIESSLVPNLTCYDCSDSFKNFWNPWSACQKNLSGVALRECHEKDKYCKVERVSIKSITLKITRGCVSECLYGCKVYGYGITQLICTSCCQGYACNTDNSSTTISVSWIVQILISFSCWYITVNSRE